MNTEFPPTPNAGVYHSQASLGSEHFVLPTAASEVRVEATVPTSRAIGMAALPEASKGEQLNKLVYAGKTSEQYAEAHQQWMANFAAHQQLMDSVERAAKAEDDKENDKKKPLVSAKKQ